MMDVAGAETSQPPWGSHPSHLSIALPCATAANPGLGPLQLSAVCRGPGRPLPLLTALGQEGRGSSPRLSRQKHEDEEGAPTVPAPAGPWGAHAEGPCSPFKQVPLMIPAVPVTELRLGRASPRRPGTRPVRCLPCSWGVHRLKPYLSFKTGSNAPLPVHRASRHTGQEKAPECHQVLQDAH